MLKLGPGRGRRGMRILRRPLRQRLGLLLAMRQGADAAGDPVVDAGPNATVKRLLRHLLAHRAMRGTSLVVTDRRWAAPLSALALGFGLFVGIAIGPGAAGSLATGAQQIIELPPIGDREEAGKPEASAPVETSPADGADGGFESTFLPSAPLAAEPSSPTPPSRRRRRRRNRPSPFRKNRNRKPGLWLGSWCTPIPPPAAMRWR